MQTVNDEQLEQVLESDHDFCQTYTDKNGWKPLGRYITDLSIDQLFDEFLAFDAAFGFDALSREQGHIEISKEPWKDDSMTVNCIIVLNLPFLK